MSTSPLIIDANTLALKYRIHQINDFLDAIQSGCQAIEEQHVNIPIQNSYHPNYFEYIHLVSIVKLIHNDIQSFNETKEKGLI